MSAQVASRTPLGQAGVEIAGDAPVTRKFLLQRERLGESVVRPVLVGSLESSYNLQELGRKDAALDPERHEAVAGTCPRHGLKGSPWA
ncbi:MAG: hypothetical protein OXG82_08935 [Gammaproteobacteria bacterium]|nr:hypothetical protein [Gammaproteobacteria bacterium]